MTQFADDDSISRQAVIEAISTWDKFGIDERNRVVRWYEGLEPYVKLRDVVWAVERLPSAQRWIPVSEQLPLSREEVNVSVCDETGDTRYNYTSHGWLTTDKEYWVVDNEINNYVVAWMPLPEPWKGEEK